MSDRINAWQQPGYGDIVSARIADGGLEVEFANGDVEWVPLSLLASVDATAEAPIAVEDGVAVRVGEGKEAVEIDWSAIRSATDPAFAQHLRDLDTEESRRVGLRLKALREDRGLSQADLAQLVGMPAPQLSRIERGGLDMRVSTVRTLLRAMGASFADIAGPDAPEVSRPGLVKAAVKMGAPRDLVASLVTAVPRQEAMSILMRAFRWSAEAIGLAAPISHPLPVAPQFKSRVDQEPLSSPLIHLAYNTAQLALPAVDMPPYRTLPADPADIRREAVDRDGEVSLRSLLEWTWARGIPVLPLEGGGGFSAAVWPVDHVPVIVLKENRDLAVFWLVDLAHEIGHAARGHVRDGLIDVDSPTQPTISDVEEAEANDFALRLLLPEHERLLAEVRADARGSHIRFKFAVERVAQRAGVSPGLLGMVAAFEATEIGQHKDRWGSATNLAKPEGSGRHQAQEIARRHLHLERLDELDAALLRVAVLGNGE